MSTEQERWDRADLSGMSPTRLDDDDPDLSPLGPGMGPRATAREGVAAGDPPDFRYHSAVGPVSVPANREFKGIDFPDLRRELGLILGGVLVAVGGFVIGVVEWFDRKRRA